MGRVRAAQQRCKRAFGSGGGFGDEARACADVLLELRRLLRKRGNHALERLQLLLLGALLSLKLHNRLRVEHLLLLLKLDAGLILEGLGAQLGGEVDLSVALVVRAVEVNERHLSCARLRRKSRGELVGPPGVGRRSSASEIISYSPTQLDLKRRHVATRIQTKVWPPRVRTSFVTKQHRTHAQTASGCSTTRDGQRRIPSVLRRVLLRWTPTTS